MMGISLKKKLSLLIVVASVMAVANIAQADGTDVRGGNGGEHIPSLNDISTMKFELSDGEAYQIGGDIVMMGNQPYLKVDLKAQPWLATASRVSFPYYPLAGGVSFWGNYVGKHVAYLCIASGDIVGGEYQISLRPIKSNSCDESMIQEIAGKPHR
jgi:hypothetical protein